MPWEVWIWDPGAHDTNTALTIRLQLGKEQIGLEMKRWSCPGEPLPRSGLARAARAAQGSLCFGFSLCSAGIKGCSFDDF